MPADEQLEQARAQVEAVGLDGLAGAMWKVHPRDLAELRAAAVDVERALGLWLVITAHPDLEGQGPQLVWEDAKG
jgi:hypothetical protein